MNLALSGIRVTFGEVRALDDVSLTVPDATIVGVTGPNGAGKTTLFNVVCGFVTPSAGTITLDGRPCRPRPERLSRLGIARTLQGIGLFDSLTVAENVLAGARHTGDPHAVMDELGLTPFGSRMPSTLPYALRKRVALARALASRPRLLLLDEPAGGLHDDEVEELAGLVAGLPARGCAVLLVDHRLDLVARVCHQVVALRDGRVAL